MSGHSKWANIKRKKEANDKVKGSIFTKASRLITLAVIEGGGVTDPDNNVKLRLAVEKAKAVSMPKDNIQRAIERGVGPNKASLKEVVYEGFASHGVALMIVCTTDNPTRTYSEIRSCIEQSGGKLGGQGSVGYLFQKCGKISFSKTDNKEEDIFVFADKVGAKDIETDSDNNTYVVYFPFEALGKINQYLNGLKYIEAESSYKPLSVVNLAEENQINHLFRLIESLESLDDVQTVFSNYV